MLLSIRIKDLPKVSSFFFFLIIILSISFTFLQFTSISHALVFSRKLR